MDIIYQKGITYRIRTIAGKNILFNRIKCFEINDVAADIWASIDGEKSISKMVSELKTMYDVSENILKEDIDTFINFLLEIEAIENV